MDQARVNRLRYRAWRRCSSEADLILGPFPDLHAPNFTAEQLDRYEALLDQDDHELYDWIIGRRPTPAAFDGEIMAMLKGFRPPVPAARQAPGA